MAVVKQVPFAPSSPFTLGVELEFQILDRVTLELVPRAGQLMALLAGQAESKVAREFLQCMIEVHTGVCRNVGEVEEDLRRTVGMAEKAAAQCGSLLFASGIHPFARPATQNVTDNGRYVRIMEELQLVGRQFIVQGLHVHVGMADRETAIRVADVMQPYLPLLLGLSASSPYFAGEDTGFCSYRTKLFEALPLAGIADFHGSWQAYEEEILMLHRAGVIREIRDLWWDVRPSPYFGTVEIRVCDMPSRFDDVLALTAFIQALAVFIGGHPEVGSSRINVPLLRYNKWQACRHGLAGEFCDPFGLLADSRRPLQWSVRRMLDVLAPVIDELGSAGWCARIHGILEQGTSTDRQRRLTAGGSSLPGMMQKMHEEFWT
ncbi:MAG: YbdK family carboxylate-amine ligase [Desulfobulbaceae bacterium]|nr:YbdK family carboxylate-amine ligase [Desulfobulbaceae bacterium]MDY0349745.1 YbdK family carboxylate-amine ligase [Desulfobulbaceae bacterium]